MVKKALEKTIFTANCVLTNSDKSFTAKKKTFKIKIQENLDFLFPYRVKSLHKTTKLSFRGVFLLFWNSWTKINICEVWRKNTNFKVFFYMPMADFFSSMVNTNLQLPRKKSVLSSIFLTHLFWFFLKAWRAFFYVTIQHKLCPTFLVNIF